MSSQSSILSSQCVKLGSSVVHYSPFYLYFHGKCKDYLQAKPTGSQCSGTGMTSSVVENRSKIQCSYSYVSATWMAKKGKVSRVKKNK